MFEKNSFQAPILLALAELSSVRSMQAVLRSHVSGELYSDLPCPDTIQAHTTVMTDEPNFQQERYLPGIPSPCPAS